MDEARTGQVIEDAAEVYERFFVPALFAQWTSPVLSAAGVVVGDRVLDVGCGTGVLARAARERVGVEGAVVGLDRNEAMLRVARRTSTTIEWRRGVAEAIPFEDSSFDRVVSQHVLMFVEDRPRVAAEMARVLRPGGRVAVATWAAIGESPGYAAMAELLAREVGHDAADALRAPFCLGTAESLVAELATAFPEVRVERHEGVARFPSIDTWVHTDIKGWTLAGTIADDTYEALVDAARRDLAGFADASGAVTFAAPALIASAQAKPCTG